ncbi:RdRP-domain-containing protein [Trametes versicolor FP-101664 SS1]|uniref:RdRP-domain-containing protein n=1 Tax=Trametes versicolor (strain FP-101664) TaxID=717944 RepID=UPI0004622500|nr:RdRP-domain-containing protein [Trametes versicolor FP-101664 SS1]EIW64750.1 RdRP-domain-containing protein [Trametes versicolor FP-101664 SS1]
MDIFMTSLPHGTTKHQLKLELASILHSLPFSDSSRPRMNFDVYVFPQKKRSPWQYGTLTLPSVDIGNKFLQIYGHPTATRFLTLGVTRVQFQRSKKDPRMEVLERVQRQSFEDPRIAQARERDAEDLRLRQVPLVTIQFGWECRDQVFSIEWEKSCSAVLVFVEERREFRIRVRGSGLDDTRIIAIRASQIGWTSAAVDPSSGVPVIFFSLSNPPSFETESVTSSLISALKGGDIPLRRKWSAFDETHEAVAPYTSLALRLEASSVDDLEQFRSLARAAHCTRPDNFAYHVERRGLFAQDVREECAFWALRQPWMVAFQVEALLRSCLVDFKEMLRLRRPIETLLRSKGRDHTAALLRDFIAQARALFWYGEDPISQGHSPQAELYSGDVVELFTSVAANFVYKPLNTALNTADATAPFHCLRVTITPTTMILEGPFPERSNRVMRKYYRSQDSFLRVCFQDENRLQLRFDREIDGTDFVNRRVKSVLLGGLAFPGARFDFLAYSQSALKEHAVWFVKPFRHTDDQGYTHFVDAAAIIGSLGTFRNLTFDPELIYCPARYAARISQAFTATDASITIDAGQIIFGSDIKDASGKREFTDGVGTISPQLAKDIWRALQENRRRGRRDRTYPRAYQIRFQGSKGMLSVDYTLPGRSILIRPSMIKFESPDSRNIEVARAFEKPAPYYLNRPLIMLLEGLGVPYEVFQRLQDNAVRDVKAAVESLERSARLLEGHGLGGSFRLTSVMLGLHKLGLGPLNNEVFWRQTMDFAINHVLRELKHRARIPVPEGWTLVGVADVHGYLEEGEIFVCIDAPDRGGLRYLEGRTLISRSPTIHPGDAQVVHAIGRPRPGSPFSMESLRNTVVFSIKGKRPLPSCLGGGDLDGDEYNVTSMPELLPPRTFYAAEYKATPRKLVDHESTMVDVAEFVAEYINSDTLGIIAITWLIIADQSTEGILDPDCLKLAALHSDAVDYPKSGQPVPIQHIPRLQFARKPDWNAPETMSIDTLSESPRFYESVRAIGKLYRSIDLPALRTVDRAARYQLRHMRQAGQDFLPTILGQFHTNRSSEEDVVFDAVRHHVAGFIDPGSYDRATVTSIWELYNSYVSRLRAICADHALENSRTAMLTEEEAVVGTIVAKCSQPRKRRDLISQLREQTATLVSDVRHELEGEDDTPHEVSLLRAWIAFRIGNMEQKYFGGHSFGWVALGGIFDTIKDIEDEERTITRRA